MKLRKHQLPIEGSWTTASDVDWNLVKDMTHLQRCRALGIKKCNAYTIWEGPSRLDGVTPIYLRVTGFARKSANGKTGNVLQANIMLREVSPVEGLKGKDSAICGVGEHACIHKPSEGGDCYVVVAQAQTSTHKSFLKNPFEQTINPWQAQVLCYGRKFRFGTYGDPVAIPWYIWIAITHYCTSTVGYTHQWKNEAVCSRVYLSFLMASCDTEEDVLLARSKGYRSFLVYPSLDKASIEPLPNMVMCPAVKTDGRVTCAACNLCDGDRAGKSDRVRKDLFVPSHGARSKSKYSNTAIA